MTSNDASRAPAGDHDDHSMTTLSIRRRSRSCCSISPASARSGPASPGRPSSSASCSIGAASSRSAPAITAISRTAPIRPAGCSSSSSLSRARAPAQKSVLWWAAKHRHHHLHSDTEADVHSPRHKGFIYSHMGWIFARRHDTVDLVKIADFARYPELMWLHSHERVPAVCAGGRLLPDRRLERAGGRLLLEHGGGVPRHLLHQFARPCARAQALRDRRRFPQQLAAWRSSPWARAGTTTTTPARAACARASAGGNTTRPFIS